MIAHQGQEATTPSPHKDSTAAYQHFARLLMQVGDGDAAVKEAEEIWVLLHKIIQECSRAHVEVSACLSLSQSFCSADFLLGWQVMDMQALH